MAFFNPPKAPDYPKKWKDMSLEFKLMFAYHGSMMLLFVAGGTLTLRQEIGLAGILVFVLISLSIKHRRAAGWRWPAIKSKNLAMAGGGIALTGVFLYAATPMFPLSNPRFLPWYLAAFGIGIFNVLQTLRLVHPSEAAFMADCSEPGSSISTAQAGQAGPTEPQWHKIARAAFTVLFVMVWLEFFVFFFYSGVKLRDGSPVETLTQVDAVTENGKTVYLTHDEKIIWDTLEAFSFVGIPLVLVGGFALQFLTGVKIFSNMPTLRLLQPKRSSKPE